MSKERSSSEVTEQLAELTRGSVEVLNLAELKKKLVQAYGLLALVTPIFTSATPCLCRSCASFSSWDIRSCFS